MVSCVFACRERREAAARAEAQAEAELISQPNGVAKLGAKFWANPLPTDLDAFGMPRSSVGQEIFTAEDVADQEGAEVVQGHGKKGNVGEGQEEGEGVVVVESRTDDEEEDLPALVEGMEEVGLGDVVDSKNIFLDVD